MWGRSSWSTTRLPAEVSDARRFRVGKPILSSIPLRRAPACSYIILLPDTWHIQKYWTAKSGRILLMVWREKKLNLGFVPYDWAFLFFTMLSFCRRNATQHSLPTIPCKGGAISNVVDSNHLSTSLSLEHFLMKIWNYSIFKNILYEKHTFFCFCGDGGHRLRHTGKHFGLRNFQPAHEWLDHGCAQRYRYDHSGGYHQFASGADAWNSAGGHFTNIPVTAFRLQHIAIKRKIEKGCSLKQPFC